MAFPNYCFSFSFLFFLLFFMWKYLLFLTSMWIYKLSSFAAFCKKLLFIQHRNELDNSVSYIFLKTFLWNTLTTTSRNCLNSDSTSTTPELLKDKVCVCLSNIIVEKCKRSPEMKLCLCDVFLLCAHWENADS